ncbi:MAG: hypothetical protein N2578_04330, partial [Bdellovibrionaceae bacterium]|nr:hypothetical protein [Pseudobdellovibrionaceae bacterium]
KAPSKILGQIMQGLNKTDRLIFWSAVVVCAMFSYFLYDDTLLFPPIEQSDMPRVGEIQSVANDVRLKGSSSFTWVPARNGHPVRLNDNLFTGEDSAAKIAIDGQGIFEFSPNSLVTFKKSEKGLSLDLRYGEINGQLEVNSTLTVITNEGNLDFQAGNEISHIKLKRTRSGKVDIQSKKGAIQVRKGDSVLTLNESRPLQMGRGSLREVTNAKIDLDTDFFFRYTPGGPFKITWTASEPLPKYKVNICEDPSCTGVVVTQLSDVSSIQVNDTINDGQWYLQVIGLDRDGHELVRSEPKPIRIAAASGPELIEPSPQSE